MLLRPQRNFTIVRQLANHLDTSTYYVRAVIRDAYTDEILATLNLDDKGSQRFSKNWLVVPDPSGQGREISIVTSVYTDSGYTTKSENYGDEENSHLIEDARVSGGGGVDYYIVRKIIKEELEKLPQPEPMPPIPAPQVTVRLDTVIDRLNELETALKPQPPEKVNLQPLVDGLSTVYEAVVNKDVTPPTDLTPVLSRLEEKDEDDSLTAQEMRILLNQLYDELEKKLPEKIAKLLNSTTFQIAPTTANMKAPEEKSALFDISKLST